MVLVLVLCITAACYGLGVGAHHLDNQHNACKDRISDLPNDVLTEIISHLPVLDAIKMSTLSRSWRNLWLNLPSLHLDWCDMSDFSDFTHSYNYKLYQEAFVKKVNQILQRFKDQNISCFRLIFFFDRSYASDVDKWIEFAAEKQLESLNLALDNPFSRLNPKSKEFYVVCSSFLSRFPYLKNLHLDSCRLMLQSNFALNMLKTLDLTYVYFEETGLQCILAQLSTIEWLQLRHCYNLPKLLCIGANLNCLRFLMISNCPNLQEIELSAENLNTFEFVGKVAVKCSFVNTSVLENVCVCLTERVFNEAESMLTNIASQISSSLRTLVLRGEYPLIHRLPNQPPLFFRSVLKLDLCMRFDDLQVDTLLALRCLLNSFPFLQKLSIRMPHTDHPEIRRRGQPPPVLFHIRLKEVKFSYFQSCWTEFASYILRSAAVLERMVISQKDKYYAGCGIWRTQVDPLPLGKEERCRINSALRGKAISPNVNVIIL